MTENEDSEGSTDLPVPSTTFSTKQLTRGLGNKATTQSPPSMQYSMPLPWPLILGIAAVGTVMLLALIVLLTWWKCTVTPTRGFYSVVKQNIRLHNQLWPAALDSTSEDTNYWCFLLLIIFKVHIKSNVMRIMFYCLTLKHWYEQCQYGIMIIFQPAILQFTS